MSKNIENAIPNSSLFESDVTGTLEQHWRKGIPTLILLLLATFVTCYYYLLVKPSIQKRYSAIVQSNLIRIGMGGIDSVDANADLGTPTSELSPQERIEILKETQLSLRRLLGWNPGDDSVHYRYGIVSHELSSSYLLEAFSSGNEAGSQLLALAKNEQQNAMAAMEKVRKWNGPFAPQANLWLIKGKIADNIVMPTSDLLLLENAVRPLLENDSVSSSAKTILAQVLVERALRQSVDLDRSKRLELLAEADQLLRSAASKDLISLGQQAEAIDIVDTAKAQEYANKALQLFWSTREAETHTTESLAAAFRCLLIINSWKEGQVFLSEQLQQLAAVDQPKFRALTAGAALRHLVSIAIKDSASVAVVANSPKNAEIVFSLAIQLAPESTELISLLQSMSKSEDRDPIVSWFVKEFASNEATTNSAIKEITSTETGVAPFIAAIVGLGKGELGESTSLALATATKLSPAYGVAASRLAVQMAVTDSIPTDVAIRWLRIINTISPEVLVAWSDRASLHLKDKQFREAIVCYEFLLEKLPGNVQLNEALEAARLKLEVPE